MLIINLDITHVVDKLTSRDKLNISVIHSAISYIRIGLIRDKTTLFLPFKQAICIFPHFYVSDQTIKHAFRSL